MTTTVHPVSTAPRAPKHVTPYAVTITTEAPLHHGAFGADTGNAVLFRRMPLAQAPDQPGVPAVSGNSVRGALRRIVMRDLFARCALGVPTGLPGATPADDLTLHQWDKLYAALANGGHLQQAETKTNPEAQRQLRDAIPPLSVFGAALYSFMLPGRLSVGWLWPRCVETVAAGLCPAGSGGFADDLLPDAESLITEITLTRHIDRDEHDPARSGVTPMPVTVEALVPGTVLHGNILPLRAITQLELGVVGYGLSLLRVLGGKGAGGFGRLRVAHEIPDEATDAYVAWLEDPASTVATREALVSLARSLA